jgi:hypothetical protein
LLLWINARYPDHIAESIEWSLGSVVASFALMSFLASTDVGANEKRTSENDTDPKSVTAGLNLWLPLLLCIAAISATSVYSLELESISWVMIALAFQTGQQAANFRACLGS